jgi:hypothetical protein
MNELLLKWPDWRVLLEALITLAVPLILTYVFQILRKSEPS